MSALAIVPYATEHRSAVLDLTMRAWTPVFEKTEGDVPRFVYDNFYPDGWAPRQVADVGALLDAEPGNIWLAFEGPDLAGFLGLRLHPEDRMGEIHVLAVAPEFQRRGISTDLMRFAEARVRAAGMRMIMVETVGDTGHAPARRAYEAFGFKRWPVAHYFKAL